MAVTVIKNYTRRIVASKKSKTGLVIGIALLIGGGIGLLAWYLHNKKKPTSNESSSSDTSNETKKDETSKDAITQIDVTAKDGTPIIVKDKKPKDTTTNKPKDSQAPKLTYPLNTKLAVRPPLTKGKIYSNLFKEIGSASSATYKGEVSDRWMIGEVTVSKGLGFENKTVYLLKNDWIKA